MKGRLPLLSVLKQTSGPTLQRKCGCGRHTIGGGQCQQCAKKNISVSAPGDQFEREADRAAAQVMRMPTPVPSNDTDSPPIVTSDLERSIQGKAAKGQPLPAEHRKFFESGFGRDFSQVRVHADSSSAEMSKRLDAEAFTFGNNIFFNSGRYAPDRPDGRHLLAHELAHVVQQNSGTVGRQIQRAAISYRQLTWSDFKMAAHAHSQWAATTASGFTADSWKTAQDVKPTGQTCTLNNRPAREFTATVSIDPSAYDKLAAQMVQEASWVLNHYKTDAAGAAYCKTTKAAECEKDIDRQAKVTGADCDSQKVQCDDFFAKHPDGGTFTVTANGVDLEAKKPEDCVPQSKSCRAETAKAFSYPILDDDGVEVATAVTRKECSGKTFQDQCAAFQKVESAWLLKHEQRHFDITNIMAGLAKADLKAKAATFTATETACGSSQALNAAMASFDALGAEDTLKQLRKDWADSNEKAQHDYDNDTDHGANHGQQTSWETTKIATGLKDYDLNAPPAPATPTPGTPTPGTPTPGATP